MSSRHDLDRINPLGITRRSKPKGVLKAADLEYMHNISEALLAQTTPRSSALLYLMVFLVLCAGIWAGSTQVDEVTLADARVITSSREQVVSSVEGGVLGELLVREGALVEKGQPLIQIETTRFEAQYAEGMKKELALKASLARLKAEAHGMPLVFPRELDARSAIVISELQAYQSKKQALDDAIASIRKSMTLLDSEIEISQKLAAQGLFSEVELSRLKRQANELNQQVTDRINRYKSDANNDMAKVEAELSQIAPNNHARLDSLNRTTLRAPVRGIVKNLRINTQGSAIPPSAPVLDIVPVDASLIFEAKLDPKEISHVHVGLPASIKLAAYDSAIYGDLEGIVDLVSPDTFREDQRPAPGQEMGYYRVLIKIEKMPGEPGKSGIQIVPGMTAVAQIKTGKKSIMDFLLKPFNQAKEAFRER